jgi:hypothetical protein
MATVSKEIIDTGNRIAEFFRDNRSLIIESAAIRFIVDDNGHIWLSEIANCKVFEPDHLSQLLETAVDNLTPLKQGSSGGIRKLPTTTEVGQDATSIASTITGTVSENVNKKKKSKIQGNSAESKPTNAPKKKRSKLDDPPSMELIAKFAAEKDR